MPRWCIYYADETTFSSDDGGPEDAPALGVIAIIQVPDTGPYIEFETDFYWWYHQLNRWIGGDLHGRIQYEISPGWKRVLCGVTIAEEKYNAIITKAQQERL